MGIKVKRNQSARGIWSGTPGSSLKVAVANLQAEISLDAQTVTLTWDAPSVSFNPSSSLYQVYRGGSFINTVPGTVTTYVDTAIQSGQEYVYQVFLIYNPL